MSLSDPIADMLTRVRNGVRIGKAEVNVKASKVCEGVANVLKQEGFIDDYDRIDDGKQGLLRVKAQICPGWRACYPRDCTYKQARKKSVFSRYRDSNGYGWNGHCGCIYE